MASLCPKCLSEVEPGRALCERCSIDLGKDRQEDGRSGDREDTSLLEGSFKPPPFVIPGFPPVDGGAPHELARPRGDEAGSAASHKVVGVAPNGETRETFHDRTSSEARVGLETLLGPSSRPVLAGRSRPAPSPASRLLESSSPEPEPQPEPEPEPAASTADAAPAAATTTTATPAASTRPNEEARRHRNFAVGGGLGALFIVVGIVSALLATGGAAKPSVSAADKHAATHTRASHTRASHTARASIRLERKTLPAAATTKKTLPAAATTKKPARTVQVSVPLTTTSTDPRPEIEVRIGNDAPLRVVLDTGSVGLRVFADLLPTGNGRGIDVTTAQDEAEYADGTQFAGVVAHAKVHIGKLTTVTTVPFQLVQQVTCDPEVGVCPASGGAQGLQSEGIDGIMGIGLGGPYQGDPAANPLLALSLPYRNSWSIAMAGGGTSLPASGTLVLGATEPNQPTAAFSLQQASATSLGSPTWNDQFDLCWDVGGQSACELTVFDSGTDVTILGGSNFANVPTDAPGEDGVLNTGTQVQCAQQVDGNPLWSFNAEGGPMQTVYVEPSGPGWVISGVQAFYSFTVTYDEAQGEIFLS
jgi:Protein of unknown function (DUF3443)